jgi:hypothetical protein
MLTSPELSIILTLYHHHSLFLMYMLLLLQKSVTRRKVAAEDISYWAQYPDAPWEGTSPLHFISVNLIVKI